MRRTCLAIARLCSAMWVGAALLYVATSVTEQVQPTFDGETKDTLALIRFPWFYGTGFTLLGLTVSATAFSALATRTRAVASSFALAALVLMGGDYLFVYRPMREYLLPEGSSRGETFERLHAWSERINVAGFLLSAATACTLSAARTSPRPADVHS